MIPNQLLSSGMVHAQTYPRFRSRTCPVIVCAPVYPMRKAYTLQQKAEAIALAAIVGSEAAAEQLGMDSRSVRKWAGQAGRAPELSAKPDQWSRLHDLAIARVTTDLASGKMKPRDVAVVAAIAKRNLSKPELPADPRTPVEQLVDDWQAWMEANLPGEPVDIGLVILIDWMEVAPDPDAPVDEAAAEAYLRSCVPFMDWFDRRAQERTRQYEAQLELNRIAAAAAQQKDLDAETQALIAAVEAMLADPTAFK